MLRERKTWPTTKTYGPPSVEWIKSDYYCMSCGKQDVWQEVGDGWDYYHQHSAECHSCQASMCCVSEVTDEPEKTYWWDTNGGGGVVGE